MIYRVMVTAALAAVLSACSAFENKPIGIGTGDDSLKRSECASAAPGGCIPVPMDWAA